VSLFVAASAAVAAESPGFWVDSDGKAAVDTPDRRSVEGFGGWLLVTSDQDWRTKWNTPRATTPKFTVTDSPRRGQKVFVLIFFGNPKLDINRAANVTCDIRLTGPNDTVPVDVRDIDCFKGPISMDPESIFVSAPVIEFIGEPEDPLGQRVVEVVLRDNHRKVEVPLRTVFELKP
jgi:hypothetical protein